MPRVNNKKELDVVNLDDEEAYITARKALDKPEDKIEDKPEDKPEDKIEDKPEDKPEDKIEDKPEDKIEDKLEVKQEDKPEVKQEVKTPCPDCGKMLSKKTLRYTHKHQCPNRPQQCIKETHAPTGTTPEQTPAKPTIMQSPYSRKPHGVLLSQNAPLSRYEHINLF